MFFDTAYSCADKTGFDTYQVDNHYARFILENEVEEGNAETCMEAFEEAHRILMTSKRGDELKHYPYRVAQGYYGIYQTFFNNLKPHEKKAFLKGCDEMLQKIDKYLSHIRHNAGQPKRDVITTKRKLEEILSCNGNS
jgi:hypothetical protein